VGSRFGRTRNARQRAERCQPVAKTAARSVSEAAGRGGCHGYRLRALPRIEGDGIRLLEETPRPTEFWGRFVAARLIQRQPGASRPSRQAPPFGDPRHCGSGGAFGGRRHGARFDEPEEIWVEGDDVPLERLQS